MWKVVVNTLSLKIEKYQVLWFLYFVCSPLFFFSPSFLKKTFCFIIRHCIKWEVKMSLNFLFNLTYAVKGTWSWPRSLWWGIIGLLVCIILAWKQGFVVMPELTHPYKFSLAKSKLKHCPWASVYVIFLFCFFFWFLVLLWWQVIFKEQLSPKNLGFLNVTELVGALSDILHVEFREGEQDLLVFDADMKPLPPGELNYNMMQTWFLIVSVRTRKKKALVM